MLGAAVKDMQEGQERPHLTSIVNMFCCIIFIYPFVLIYFIYLGVGHTGRHGYILLLYLNSFHYVYYDTFTNFLLFIHYYFLLRVIYSLTLEKVMTQLNLYPL